MNGTTVYEVLGSVIYYLFGRNVPRKGAQYERKHLAGEPRPVGGELHI